jgi:hypothetical protein
VYRRPNTSKPAQGHKIYPYLLRGMKIERQRWLGLSEHRFAFYKWKLYRVGL